MAKTPQQTLELQQLLDQWKALGRPDPEAQLEKLGVFFPPGRPTRTYSRRFDIGAHGGYANTPFGGGGSFQAKGGETYDLWFYQERKVTLMFDHEGDLVYWIWSAEPPSEKLFQTDKIN